MPLACHGFKVVALEDHRIKLAHKICKRLQMRAPTVGHLFEFDPQVEPWCKASFVLVTRVECFHQVVDRNGTTD